MTDQTELIPPLVVEFEVATAVDRAFAVWVDRATTWWPRGHTISEDLAAVVFEGRVGGRIFERGADGTEVAWGEILVWDPPGRFECLWHLGFTRDEATRVAVTFTAAGESTRVRLEQTGWDALGEAGPPRRERTVTGWGVTTGAYRDYLADQSDDTNDGGRP